MAHQEDNATERSTWLNPKPRLQLILEDSVDQLESEKENAIDT